MTSSWVDIFLNSSFWREVKAGRVGREAAPRRGRGCGGRGGCGRRRGVWGRGEPVRGRI